EPLLDLGAGQPRELARVPLPQVGVDDHRPHPQLLGDDRRGVAGSLQVGRPDGVDGAERPGRLPRLAATELAERRVGLALPPPDGVPLGLAVADEQEAGGGRLGAHGHGTLPGAATRRVRGSAGWRRPAAEETSNRWGCRATSRGRPPPPPRRSPRVAPGGGRGRTGPWPSSGSSPRPARPPAPVATSSTAPPSTRCSPGPAPATPRRSPPCCRTAGCG